MSRNIRYPVHGTTQAPVTQTIRIRTRLYVSKQDRLVLESLARHFDSLQSRDLARRCKDGSNSDNTAWADRKRELTAECSSRWAGWITKNSNDAWSTARRNQRRHLSDLESAISTIERKLAFPIHRISERKAIREAEAVRAKTENRKPRTLYFGYRSAHEHAMKRMRLDHLKSERDKLKKDLDDSVVHITRGGKYLMKNRLHLEETGIDENTWRAEWYAKRRSFGANGETSKLFGNETIRVHPDGTVEIDLPEKFSHLANVTKFGTTRYRMEAKAVFSYRTDDWLAQVRANRAIAYEVVLAAFGRIYLDASFTPAVSSTMAALRDILADPAQRILSLDLNHGFLAPAVLDHSGNLLGRPAHISLVTEDLPATTRDGHLRQAITEVLDMADLYGCHLIAVENLGFHEMRASGREEQRSSPWFQKVVCGMPTAQFCNRLVAMASRRGILVVGVPAAYSSIWGAQYWQGTLSSKSHKISKHTAAAVVLGRRALGYRARCKAQASPGVTVPDQRIEEAGQPAGTESYHEPSTNGKRPEGKGTPKLPRREGIGHRARGRPKTANARSGDPRLAKTVRVSRVSLKGT